MGKIPWKGNGNPLQSSCVQNRMDRGGWWATVHGVRESQTRLNARTHTALQSSPASVSELVVSPPGGPPPGPHQVSTGPHWPLAGQRATIAALSSAARLLLGCRPPPRGRSASPRAAALPVVMGPRGNNPCSSSSVLAG